MALTAEQHIERLARSLEAEFGKIPNFDTENWLLEELHALKAAGTPSGLATEYLERRYLARMRVTLGG